MEVDFLDAATLTVIELDGAQHLAGDVGTQLDQVHDEILRTITARRRLVARASLLVAKRSGCAEPIGVDPRAAAGVAVQQDVGGHGSRDGEFELSTCWMLNWFFPAGRLLTDTILERVENRRWVWQISNFNCASMFCVRRAVGQWDTAVSDTGGVDVRFSYRYFPSHAFFAPLDHLLVRIQVRGMLEQALAEIEKFAESDAPLLYD